MSDIKLDIPDITVVVNKGDEYLANVTPSEIYNVIVNTGDVYDVSVTSPNVIVDGENNYFSVAEYAILAATASYISGSSVIATWDSLLNKPAGIVSSSTQINTGSFAGTFIGTSSWAQNAQASQLALQATSASYAPTILPTGIVSSSTQATGWSVASASYAVTASYVVGDAGVTDWTEITNIPTGIVSSSTQVELEQLSGTTFASASYTFSGSVDVIQGITGSLNSQQIAVNSGISSVYISSSVISGIFNETRIIDPPIKTTEFSGTTIDYTAQRSTDIRTGTLFASWSGSSVSYTDVSSVDIGDAYDLSFNLIRIGDDIRLRAYSVGSGSGDWSVQFLFKFFPKLV